MALNLSRVALAPCPVIFLALATVTILPASSVGFDSDSGGWTSIGFGYSPWYPEFLGTSHCYTTGPCPLQGTVQYHSIGGNPGGYISSTDPDANWQYFESPAAFIGDQSAAMGGSLTFDLRLSGFGVPALNPQGPLVALTGGSLALVYAGSWQDPGTAWNSYAIALAADGSWKVGTPNGTAATSAQLAAVLSNLSGLYILADYTQGDAQNGEVVGLDNVALNTGNGNSAPEPGTLFLAAGCIAAGFASRRIRFSRERSPKGSSRDA